MKTFNEVLNELKDKGLEDRELPKYEYFKRWAADKTWQEVYDTCERGDWLIWLFEKTAPKEERLLVLVCGHCANIIRRLMKDQRSLAAVDAAIAYGEGKINKEEFTYVGYAAFSAAKAARDSKVHGRDLDWAIARVAAYVVQVPDNDSCFTLDEATYAAALYASDAGAAAEYNERVAYRRKCADIIRKYIPIGKFNILNVADSAATAPKEEPVIDVCSGQPIADVGSENMPKDQIIGYILREQYRDYIYKLCPFLFTELHIKGSYLSAEDYYAPYLSYAGVLDLWFDKVYKNEEPAIEDKTPVKFKNKPLFFLYTSNPHYQRILKMYGEKYTIEPILLDRSDEWVTMENLESNQIVCTGDGEYFYFLLTER